MRANQQSVLAIKEGEKITTNATAGSFRLVDQIMNSVAWNKGSVAACKLDFCLGQ